MKINTPPRPPSQVHRKKTDPYYTSKKHKGLREQAYLRDNGKCQVCGKMLSHKTPRDDNRLMAIADHVIPKELVDSSTPERIRLIATKAGVDPELIEDVIKYGPDIVDNYQTLCKHDHDVKSNKDKEYYR